MPEVEFTINPSTGELEIHVKGIAGPACDDVARLAKALLGERDGVSILGGEPFQQPDGLLALVRALRDRGCRHVLVSSGYTYERLRWMAEWDPAVGEVLDEIEMLVDEPYVAALSGRAGP